MTALATQLAREVVGTRNGEWSNGPLLPTIFENEAHIWKVDLSRSSLNDFQRLLSPDELERAARFHFGKDRDRFLIAHASLRIILGRYLRLPPASLLFAQTEFGKPFLINPEAAGLLFNLSYSEDIAVIAVTRDREVGVDVEIMRADLATSEVAENFFSVAEIYTLSGLDPNLRTQSFFNCWTRKEAYVKARGEGMTMPLDQFDVSLSPGVRAAMLGNRLDDSERSRWIFQDLQIGRGYAAAIVMESSQRPPRLSSFMIAP